MGSDKSQVHILPYDNINLNQRIGTDDLTASRSAVHCLDKCMENKAAMDTNFDSKDRLSRNGSVDQLVQVAVIRFILPSNREQAGQMKVPGLLSDCLSWPSVLQNSHTAINFSFLINVTLLLGKHYFLARSIPDNPHGPNRPL